MYHIFTLIICMYIYIYTFSELSSVFDHPTLPSCIFYYFNYRNKKTIKHVLFLFCFVLFVLKGMCWFRWSKKDD